MDPLAHSLVGAALAETGLRRTTPLATPTLIIGANLPDLDAVASLAGKDTSLLLRRGVTHGAIALVLLPWALAGTMLLYDRLRRRRHPDRGPPPRFAVLLALSYVGVLSHPLLDWLNTYGVRLLEPFSGRWFYGDTLFIIDPWMWLLAGCSVVLARARTRQSLIAWGSLGTATSLLVLFSGRAPGWAMVVWCAAVVGIALARRRRGADSDVVPIARVTLALLTVYVVAMFAGSRLAERQVRRWARVNGLSVEDVLAGPLPASPFRRDVVVVTPDAYRFFELAWFAEERLRPSDPPMPRLDLDDPIVAAALDAPEVRGFRSWMRLPSARVEPRPDGHRVVLYDVRYARGDERPSGIGRAVVELDADLRPR